MSVLIDIGGSGIKMAEYSHGSIGEIVNYYGRITTYEDFIEAIRKKNRDKRIKGVAISAAGFINAEEGKVIQCRCAPFLEGDIVRRLNKEFPFAKIQIVNDGEAHARSLLLPENNVRFGAIHLALGTSVSFGVINEKKEIVKACNGENWDIGDYQLRTREAPYDVWYKLGTDGLSELENNDSLGGDAYRHYGLRLGGLLRNLAVIFRPRTIGLSGGIISSHGDEILNGVRQEWKDEGFSAPVKSAGIEFKVLKRDTTVMEGLTTLLKLPTLKRIVEPWKLNN